jgi:tetratricopeptide (TPR) repeat protein
LASTAWAEDAGAPDGGSGSGEDRYYEASELERAGQHAEAVAAFLKLADDTPGDRFAVFALMEAARIDEVELAEPEQALELYQRVLRQYPDSRESRRAEARVAILKPNLAGGAEPWREYQAVLNGFATRPHAESIARIEALLAKTPDFPAAPQVTLFLAGAYRDDGRTDDARGLYLHITERWPKSPAAAMAWQELGTLALRAHDWDGARADFERLRDFDDPNLERMVEDSLKMVRREQHLDLVYRAALGVLAGFFLLHAALIAVPGRARRPQAIPVELAFYLPLAALFALVSLSENPAIMRATLTITGGGALIVWLTANALRCRPPARRTWLARATAHALACVLAVSSLGFVAVHRAYLTTLVAETLEFGAER